MKTYTISVLMVYMVFTFAHAWEFQIGKHLQGLLVPLSFMMFAPAIYYISEKVTR